jgi:hypothetical protein
LSPYESHLQRRECERAAKRRRKTKEKGWVSCCDVVKKWRIFGADRGVGINSRSPREKRQFLADRGFLITGGKRQSPYL